jgi:hypothetical protein
MLRAACRRHVPLIAAYSVSTMTYVVSAVARCLSFGPFRSDVRHGDRGQMASEFWPSQADRIPNRAIERFVEEPGVECGRVRRAALRRGPSSPRVNDDSYNGEQGGEP